MIEFVPATIAHIGPLAHRMREIDRLECAIMGHKPKQALRLSLMGSSMAWTAKVDGRVEAMFGVSPVSTLEGIGSPWMLMSEGAVKHRRALLILGRSYSDQIQARFPILENRVHADNHIAIRWLERLGYTIGEQFVMNGHLMRNFRRCATQ